jgi:hypothetical protein
MKTNLCPFLFSLFLLGSGSGSSSSRAAAATTASGVNNSQAPVDTSANVPDGSAMEESHVLPVINEEAANNVEAVNDDETVNHEEEDMSEESAEGEEEANPPPVRDVAMENELAHEMTGDALDDYDIDVSNEGQAISEYLSLLDSAA